MKRVSLVIGVILTVAVIVAFIIAMLSSPLSKIGDQVESKNVTEIAAEIQRLEKISNFTTLIADFDNLPEIKDGIDLKEKKAKEEILFLLRSDDPEIEKAFGVMQEYGRPLNFTSYDFPTHNTQLEVLLWLAEEREISDYDIIALAIALDYGAVLAISEEEVGKELKDYVLNLYDYFVETDEIVPWEIEEYSLEANIALIWGADGIYHPFFFDRIGQYPEGTKYGEIRIPHYYDLNWVDVFQNRKMNEEDFDWLFVDVSTLREIRVFLMSEVFSEGFKGLSVDDVSERMDSMLCGSLEYPNCHPSDEIKYTEVEGRITPGCGLSNPDWQWKRFNREGRIMGNCRDVTCMDIFFLKSLNIPAIGIGVKTESFGHHVVVFYDSEDENLWRITSNQERIIGQHAGDSRLFVGNYFPVVWRNWHGRVRPDYDYKELNILREGFEICEA